MLQGKISKNVLAKDLPIKFRQAFSLSENQLVSITIKPIKLTENGLTEEEEEEILQASEEASRGVNVSPLFSSAKEAIAYLHKEAARYNLDED